MRADEFYPIFGLLGLFWRILCTLVHFGENMVSLGAPRKWVTAVTLASIGLGYAYMGWYFGSLDGTNMHSVGRLWALLWPWYPQLHICMRTEGVPKMTMFSPKYAKKAQRVKLG